MYLLEWVEASGDQVTNQLLEIGGEFLVAVAVSERAAVLECLSFERGHGVVLAIRHRGDEARDEVVVDNAAEGELSMPKDKDLEFRPRDRIEEPNKVQNGGDDVGVATSRAAREFEADEEFANLSDPGRQATAVFLR